MLDKCVYIHRRLDDGKVFYVGMGTNERPHHKHSRNDYWKNTAMKHGFYVEILTESLDVKSAVELECLLIHVYGFENLTNLTLGGETNEGRVLSEETKRKISEGNKGKKHTKDSKLKISKSLKGKVHVRKEVLDTETGIYYESLRYACYCTNSKYNTERSRIVRGHKSKFKPIDAR